jgi:hypothetical protein
VKSSLPYKAYKKPQLQSFGSILTCRFDATLRLNDAGR